MSGLTRQKNNTIAGFFVLMTIVGFVAIVIVLSDVGSLGSRKSIRIAFAPDVGIPGVMIGSEIQIAGRPVGRVTSIETERDPQHGGIRRFVVNAWIPTDYEIGQDAFAGMVVPLIGGTTSIDITPMGLPGSVADSAFFASGGALNGGYAPSILLRTAGIGPEEIDHIKSTIQRVDVIAGNVEEITTDVRRLIKDDGAAGMDTLVATIDDLNAIIADIREKWPQWRAEFDTIVANINATSERGPEIASKAESLIDNVNAGVDDVRTVVNNTSPNIEQSAQNVAEITSRVKSEILDQMTERIAQAEALFSSATQTFELINDSLTTEVPQIARILGNLRLASDNLKLATIEIRSEPWRLLYTPSSKEASQSILHDAVRTYASAVSDLEASVTNLKALHDRYGPDLAPESPLVQGALKDFENRLERYQAEEKRWAEILFDAGIKP